MFAFVAEDGGVELLSISDQLRFKPLVEHNRTVEATVSAGTLSAGVLVVTHTISTQSLPGSDKEESRWLVGATEAPKMPSTESNYLQRLFVYIHTTAVIQAASLTRLGAHPALGNIESIRTQYPQQRLQSPRIL